MATNKNNAQEITFEITEHIGDLSLSSSGWSRELNLVSWNGREARYDIRSWNEDHSKMSKGITLCRKEVEALAKHLASRF